MRIRKAFCVFQRGTQHAISESNRTGNSDSTAGPHNRTLILRCHRKLLESDFVKDFLKSVEVGSDMATKCPAATLSASPAISTLPDDFATSLAVLIPSARLVVLFAVTRRNLLKSLAIRLCVLVLAVAFIIPCNTHITDIVAFDLTAYFWGTIEEIEGGTGKLQEAMEGGGEKTIFEKLSDLFQTVIRDLSDLLLYFQNTFASM